MAGCGSCTDVEIVQRITGVESSSKSSHNRIDELHQLTKEVVEGIRLLNIASERLESGQNVIIERGKQADIINTNYRNKISNALEAVTTSNDLQDVAFAKADGAREAREKIMNTYGAVAVVALLGFLAWASIEIIQLKEADAKDHKHELVGITKQVKAKARTKVREGK